MQTTPNLQPILTGETIQLRPLLATDFEKISASNKSAYGDTNDVYIKKIDEGVYDMGFLLFPISVAELIKIADLGEIMPPKSTWFEPKFLVGLITHEIN